MTALRGRWVAPVHDGPLADAATLAALTAQLAAEAEAVDDRDFESWTSIVADGFVYQVPVPMLSDDAFGPRYHADSLLIDEDKASIVETWFGRFADGVYDVAWGDHPPVRQRHYVTNVRVRNTAVPDEFDVRSNVLLRLVRQTHQAHELGAERYDRWRRAGDRYELLSRYAVLDDLVLDSPLVRVLL